MQFSLKKDKLLLKITLPFPQNLFVHLQPNIKSRKYCHFG
jgi:hypothetical protein